MFSSWSIEILTKKEGKLKIAVIFEGEKGMTRDTLWVDDDGILGVRALESLFVIDWLP